MQPYMVCVSWLILRHITDQQRDELRDIGLTSNIKTITATPDIRVHDVFWEVDRVEGGVENLYSTLKDENNIKSVEDLVAVMYQSLFRKRPNLVCERDGGEDEEQTMTDNQEEEENDDIDHDIFTEEEGEDDPPQSQKKTSKRSLETSTLDVLQSMEKKRKQLFSPRNDVFETSSQNPRGTAMMMAEPQALRTNLQVDEEYDVCLVPGGNAVDVQAFCDAVHTWQQMGFTTPSHVCINRNNAQFEKDVPVERLVKYVQVKREYYKAKKRVDELRFMDL